MPEAQAVLLVPDDVLVVLARGGDPSAREELFRRHWGVAIRVARRQLGQDQDAEDAVQDASIKALRHLDGFDGRAEFRTWFLKIVTNASLDAGRRKKRRPTVRIEDAEAGGAEVSTEDDPALGLHRGDLRKRLDAALAKLSPAIRATFVLFAEAELSYKEIAETLNVPPGTVMSRIHFARQKLQASLEGVEGIR